MYVWDIGSLGRFDDFRRRKLHLFINFRPRNLKETFSLVCGAVNWQIVQPYGSQNHQFLAQEILITVSSKSGAVNWLKESILGSAIYTFSVFSGCFLNLRLKMKENWRESIIGPTIHTISSISNRFLNLDLNWKTTDDDDHFNDIN